MHQTTVRFTADLWSQLEREARRTGVSVAQYVRDAALARVAYTAGRLGEPLYGGPEAAGHTSLRAENASAAARERQSDSNAVWAQARLARERARKMREDAIAARPEGRGRRARA